MRENYYKQDRVRENVKAIMHLTFTLTVLKHREFSSFIKTSVLVFYKRYIYAGQTMRL